jgi:hypothetical protein
MRAGTVLVDPTDPGTSPRVLFFLEQAIRDARPSPGGEPHVISREVHFVEIDEAGNLRTGGGAPYLDYRPATDEERARLAEHLDAAWLSGEQLEDQVIGYAVEHLIPRHLERVRTRREALVEKTRAAVQERLTKEINYWDRRAAELRLRERDGKPIARLNAEQAQRRADELQERLETRKHELDLERNVAPGAPVIIGGALIIPAGLVYGEPELQGIIDRRITEAIAMQAVMEAERALGYEPIDVSADNEGYDILSRDPRGAGQRFVEVKGRRAGAETITVTFNEIMKALNVPEQYILAIVEVEDGQARPPRYVRRPFAKEPDGHATSVNYNIGELLRMSEEPR